MRENRLLPARPLLIAVGIVLLAVLGYLSLDRIRANEALAERRERIESLSPAEKAELWERQNRFGMFDRAEQERIRGLHAELAEDPEGEELRRVMESYYVWLKNIPPYQQAELHDLAPPARVQRIKRMMEEQARKAKGPIGPLVARRMIEGKGFLPAVDPAKRMRPDDVEALLYWIDEYAKRHGTEFLENLPAKQRQELEKELSRVTDPLRRQELLGAIWVRWQLENPGKMPPLAEKDLADLRAKLSPETRKRLEGKPLPDQWRIISALIPLFLFHQHAAGRPDAAAFASEEELARFFEKELSSLQRDRLLSLPADEMTRELWRMYIRWKITELAARKAERPPSAKRPGSLRPSKKADRKMQEKRMQEKKASPN